MRRPRTEGRRHQNYALALLFDAMRTPPVDPQLLEAALGLSSAQSSIAALLAQGHTVVGIAAATHLSQHGVRWHIHQMYARLGVSRQADLIRVLLTLDRRALLLRATEPATVTE